MTIPEICNKLVEYSKAVKDVEIDETDIRMMNKFEVMNTLKGEYNEIEKNLIEILHHMESNIKLIGDTTYSMFYELTKMNHIYTTLQFNAEILKKLITHYHYQPLKDKWEITIDVMMIIGKYFRTNADYINVMKVNEKYKDLTSMYHFNPISDTSLFVNMETQHFYCRFDSMRKKDGIFGCKYWYEPKNIHESFEFYIQSNIPTLERWCG